MNFHQQIKSSLLILCLSFILFQNCSGQVSAGDTFLFGLSEQFEKLFGKEVATAVCSTDVTITTKKIDLVEDGNVSASFSTTEDSGVTPAPTENDWGYSSFETCIYPSSPFTGSVEIPVSLSSNYGTRITSAQSVPGPAAFPSKLTFTGNGLTARQCLRFTVVNDGDRSAVVDPMTVDLGKMVQKDGDGKVTSGTYSNKDACDISVSLEDDEAPGVRVSNIRVMEEPGPSATTTYGTFKVKLRTAPSANVTIPINDVYDAVNVGNREGTTNPKTLTFTLGTCPGTGNWCADQTVRVDSVDDLELDGLKSYTIELGKTTSTDSDYNGIKPRNVVVYNLDQSVPGFSVLKFSGGSTINSASASVPAITGFATDENNQFGDKYSNFQIRLRSKPTNNVTLNFTSDCGNKCTIQTPSLVFTPSDWNTYQTFRAIGKTDSANSGNQNYTVSFTVSSSDTTYSTTVYKPSVTIRSCDNDGTHLIQPCNYSGSPLGTIGNQLSAAEGGSTQIWLITQSSPGGSISVGLTSSDTSEGTVPASVSIDASNYNTMETGATNRIGLAHVDDALVDLTQYWTITTATSSGGLTYDPIDIYAATTDDEKAFYVTHTGSPKEGTANVATVHVCLGGNNPTQQVVLNISCKTYTATEAAYNECDVITPTQITFPVNSEVETMNASDSGCAASAKKQSFTVSGKDDLFADGNQPFDIRLVMAANTDTNYQNATSPSDHSITNEDDEPAGKKIFTTANSYKGEMGTDGVFGADLTCNNNKPTGVSGTYKALIISNSVGDTSIANHRVPNGINWILSPNYHYYRCTGSGYNVCSDEYTRLFITDGSALFNPTSMSRDFSTTASDEFWTGMTNSASLTPATQTALNPDATACNDATLVYRQNCHGFNYETCTTNSSTYFYGEIWVRNGNGSVSNASRRCDLLKKLICVEQ
ncbi:DUF1554 domain-containing protein [Leptospira bandrabouensis]|uniref:DUF1554 domain-containing protein n=1 Tax=Leptospira bandrabouensis TaxID=2484903 RepID=UPI00223E2099|nr:DUF1554 domain-containing protein [Leptospira bandrabouensis]MCW7459738.1 DUF1554 domain-containing protein [Leptospira bandrabouensis]MCW7477149.1 DUF1554 domain-containing protein [Leptospira bandrabouensis]MCW7484831.1 DUF1554 domain-containing protein [Leptospira bandrabouensis]